jgi:hypothetical protein
MITPPPSVRVYLACGYTDRVIGLTASRWFFDPIEIVRTPQATADGGSVSAATRLAPPGTARPCGGAMWRCSSRRGVVDEPASPTHDRGHANPQPGAAYATCLRRTGDPVRPLFRKSPKHLGPAEIRTYQLYLAHERHLAASSIIVAVAALRFFYTVTLKRPWIVEDDIPTGRQAKKLPVVLSQDESDSTSQCDGINALATAPASKSPKQRPVICVERSSN